MYGGSVALLSFKHTISSIAEEACLLQESKTAFSPAACDLHVPPVGLAASKNPLPEHRNPNGANVVVVVVEVAVLVVVVAVVKEDAVLVDAVLVDVGGSDGATVGDGVDGACDGDSVGDSVGAGTGLEDGDRVGSSVGSVGRILESVRENHGEQSDSARVQNKCACVYQSAPGFSWFLQGVIANSFTLVLH